MISKLIFNKFEEINIEVNTNTKSGDQVDLTSTTIGRILPMTYPETLSL